MGERERQVWHYVQRAEDFLRSGKLLYLEPRRYGNAAALLAIHAAIALGDALTVHCGGRRSRSEDHAEAVQRLGKLVRERRKNSDGIKRLAFLIGSKTHVAYGDKRTELKLIDKLYLEVQRFFDWAYAAFPEIAAAAREYS